MVAQLLAVAIALLITITVIAIGSYVGTLRALDVFYSGEDSVFLSEDAGPHQS